MSVQVVNSLPGDATSLQEIVDYISSTFEIVRNL